jgi:hypothetical protein
VVTVTGRPWDEIEDTLTASRLFALHADWRIHPPVNDLVAGYLKYTPPAVEVAAAPVNPDDPSGIGGMIMMNPSGFVQAS